MNIIKIKIIYKETSIERGIKITVDLKRD